MSFPQKVIASGMSLVLAFGLSPLGQVPAYADTGDDAPIAAQATEVTEKGDLATNYLLKVSDVVYDGDSWTKSTDSALVEAGTTDRLIANGFVSVYKINQQTKARTLISSTLPTSGYVYQEEGEKTGEEAEAPKSDAFQLVYKNAAGEVISPSATGGILDAGTYTVQLVGKGSYRGDYATATFEVKPYDLGDVVAFNATELAELSYMGKAVSVRYNDTNEAWAAGDYPVAVIAKDVNGTAGEYSSGDQIVGQDDESMVIGSSGATEVTIGTSGKLSYKAGDAKPITTLGQLTQKDITFEPATVTGRGYNDVTVKGRGNFTGSFDARVMVGVGTFSTEDNLTVNGALNSAKNKIDKGAAGATIDLGTAEANPTVQSPDPVETGKVVFGEKVLTKGSDYSATYARADGKSLEDDTVAPTAIGEYVVTIKAISSDFAKGADTGDTVTIHYNVTVGSTIDEVAEKANFGTAPYVPAMDTSTKKTVANDSVDADVADSRVFRTREALTIPSNVKFVSAAGADVTSTIGSNYQIVGVREWTEAKERAFLGDAEYDKQYPYADAPYVNSDEVVDYFKDETIVSNENTKDADKYEYTDARNNKTTYYGFNGLPAGDYELIVKGAGDYASSTKTVSGKFKVVAATPVEGTAAGQLKVTKYKGGLVGKTVTPAILDEAKGLRVAVNAGEWYDADTEVTGATEAKDYALTSENLRVGSPYEVRTGQADYYVTYKKDNEEVDTPTTAGTYDAVLTFGGSYYESASITVEGAVVIDKAELNAVADIAVVDQDATYQYTGSAVVPKLKFYKGTTEAGTKVLTDFQSDLAKATTSEGVTALWAAFKAKVANENVLETNDISDVTATVGKDGYTVTAVGMTNDATLSGGQPVGVGSYELTIKGAGKYMTTKDNELKISPTQTTGFVQTNPTYIAGTGFEVSPLVLDNTAKAAKYYTVQYQDGDQWVENYSTVKADKNAEPAFRLVVAETAGKESPTVISDKLYKHEFDYSQLATDGVGTVGLKLTPKSSYATGEGDTTTQSFHIAAQSFDSVKAKLVLSSATGTYDVNGQGLTFKVATNDGAGSELNAQYEGSTSGQYVWTITGPDGSKLLESSDIDVEGDKSVFPAAAASLVKGEVTDAGTYKVTVSGGQTNEYAGTLTETFTVSPKEITDSDKKLTVKYFNGGTTNSKEYANGAKISVFTSGKDISYEGEETAFTELDADDADDATKAVGNKYVLSGADGVNAGTYEATIEFKGNYSGTVKKTWKITPIDIKENADNYVILADDKLLADSITGSYSLNTGKAGAGAAYAFLPKTCYNVDYNGAPQEPTVDVYKNTGEVGKEVGDPVKGLKYTYLYSNNTDASDGAYASVTIVSEGGNYTGRITKYFPINTLAIGGDRVTVSFSNDELRYTGKEISPTGTLKYTLASGEVLTLKAGKDYQVTYTGNRTNPGDTATAKFTGLAPNFAGGVATFVTQDFTVLANPSDQTITASDVKVNFNATKAIGAKAQTNMTYKSSDESVATVDANGNVKGVKVGTAKITITAEGTDLYKEATKTIDVAVAAIDNPFTAKSLNPKVSAKKTAKKAQKVKAAKAFKVTGNLGGKVTYKKASGSAKIKVSSAGKVTVKKNTKKGTYKAKVDVTAAAKGNYKKTTKTVTLKVKVTK